MPKSCKRSDEEKRNPKNLQNSHLMSNRGTHRILIIYYAKVQQTKLKQNQNVQTFFRESRESVTWRTMSDVP